MVGAAMKLKDCLLLRKWGNLDIPRFMTNLDSIFGEGSGYSSTPAWKIPWTAACQAFLSITNSRRLLKLMSIELVIPSSHLVLCRPLLLLPSIFPSIRVLTMFSINYFIMPPNIYPVPSLYKL